MSYNHIVRVLLFGNKPLTRDTNLRIIKSSISFIKESKRFNKPLFLDIGLFKILNGK